jgi:hypothetical protein
MSDELLVQLFCAAQGDITQFRIKAREILADGGKGEAVAVIGPVFQLLYCRENWSEGLKVGMKLYTAPPAECAPRDALAEAVDLTIKTLERQLDLIDERAPGNYLDKMPVIRSLSAHKQRLERAVEQAKEQK